MMDQPKLIDSKAAAAFLNIGNDTVRQLCREQKLPHYRIGGSKTHARYAFDLEELKAYRDGAYKRVNATKVEVR